MLNHQQVEHYLHRLKLPQLQRSGDHLKPTIQTLSILQKAHLFTIAFENLDIHLKRPISLNLDEVYNKVITNHRGGFCYELNSLFYALLKTLGYGCSMISAKVYNATKDSYGADFDHMALLVVVDTVRYLVDVGFGELTYAPLLIDSTDVQYDTRNHFAIHPFDETSYQLNKINPDGSSIAKYRFSTKTCLLSDFYEMSHYHQSSPDSFFTQGRLITQAHKGGRITLHNHTLKITQGKSIHEILLADDSEYSRALFDCFHIKL